MLCLVAIGCDRNTDQPEQKPVKEAKSKTIAAPVSANQNTQAIWLLSEASLSNYRQTAAKLQQYINTFLASPTEEHLQQARHQWHQTFRAFVKAAPLLYLTQRSHLAFSKVELLRFNIGAWPIAPGYLDHYGVYRYSGLVNAIHIPLSTTQLQKQHGLTAPEEATLGLHPIEFLLWGENANRSNTEFTRQISKPPLFKDDDIRLEDLPNNRRRLLLKLQTTQLLGDSQQLLLLWQANGSIQQSFAELSFEQKLQAINQSISRFLTHWATLLASTDSEEELFQGFAGKRTIALIQAIESISDIYYKKDTNFAELLLNEETRLAFKNSLDIATQLLEENSTSSLKDAGDQLWQAVALLSSTKAEVIQ